MRSVYHSEDLPVPHPATHKTVTDYVEDETNTGIQNEHSDDIIFKANTSSSELYLLTANSIWIKRSRLGFEIVKNQWGTFVFSVERL